MLPSPRLLRYECNYRISLICRYHILPVLKTKTEIPRHRSQTVLSFPVPLTPSSCYTDLLLIFFSFLFPCLSVLTHYLLLRLFAWSAHRRAKDQTHQRPCRHHQYKSACSCS